MEDHQNPVRGDGGGGLRDGINAVPVLVRGYSDVSKISEDDASTARKGLRIVIS